MSRVNIPASPKNPNSRRRFTHEVIVVLGDGFDATYSAAGKDFPDPLPKEWIDPKDKDKKKKSIEWITNFGITKDGQQAKTLPGRVRYTVLLPKSDKKFVTLVGGVVTELTLYPTTEEGFGGYAEFADADPPIGMT